MLTLLIHPKDKAQEKIVKAILKALKVPFEIEPESNESPYDPEFVAKILEGREYFKNGRGTTIKIEDLWK